MHPLKKAFFVALGCISLALGTIGIALPILPTVPFYLLTAFCFANSSFIKSTSAAISAAAA